MIVQLAALSGGFVLAVLCVTMGYLLGHREGSEKAQSMAQLAVTAERLRCRRAIDEAPAQRCLSLNKMGLIKLPTAQVVWRKN